MGVVVAHQQARGHVEFDRGICKFHTGFDRGHIQVDKGHMTLYEFNRTAHFTRQLLVALRRYMYIYM